MPEAKPQEFTSVSHFSRLAGASSAVLIETLIGVPFDKYKNTTMASKISSTSMVQKILIASVGPDYAQLSKFQSITRCYQGLVPYGAYKLVNRGGKLFVHPFLLENIMRSSQYHEMSKTYKSDHMKVAVSAFCGGLIGCAEVVLNPMDRLKVLCQVNNLSLVNSMKQMVAEGWRIQFSAWQATLLRNTLGTSALFAGKYYTYQKLKLKDHNRPSWLQSSVASCVGSFSMIATSHLPDLVKVRIQKNPLENRGIWGTLKHVAKSEGYSSLWQGFTPKLVAVGFKAIFALTASDMIVSSLSKEEAPQSPKFRV